MSTQLFIGNHETNEFHVCKLLCDNICLNSLGDDDRLIRIGKHIFLHSTSCYQCFKVKINVNECTAKIKLISSLNIFNQISSNLRGKNYGIVSLSENDLIVLDGINFGVLIYHRFIGQSYQTKGISYTYQFQYVNDHRYCTPANKHIDTCGSLVQPLFSMGPSKLITIKDKQYILCAGHIKLLFHFDQSNENMKTFIDSVQKKFEKIYGDTYVPHYEYMYLLCFYLFELDSNKNITKSLISRAILPVFDNFNLPYNFSLFFPMGLEVTDNNVIVSGGYGDYYSTVIQFRLDHVIDICKCDMHDFDIDTYEFCLYSVQ